MKTPRGDIEINTRLFINNEWIEGDGTFDVTDPVTDEIIAKVSRATSTQVDQAVAAARGAFESWRQTDPAERGKLLYKLAELVDQNAEKIATVEAWEAGKAYEAEALPTVRSAAKCLRYYAGFADKIHGSSVSIPGKLGYTIREPIGVCGQIVPWNYPVQMAVWKLAPALCAGNCCVLKPSELTPLSMQIVAALIQQAGFPAGVVNIVNGAGDTGAAIAAHADVDKVAFTGSTATGRRIMKTAADTLKNVTLECGGKSPMIVFEDADLDRAVASGWDALMSNQGQTCTALTRYYIHESVHDEFVSKFVKYIKQHSRLAAPFDSAGNHGPQISKLQHSKIMGYISQGVTEGAVIATGGKVPAGMPNYVEPTLFTNVTNEMTIMQEEIFGPVGCIAKFSTEDQAVVLSNDSQYGLGASIFTSDISRATRVASRLQSGQVWINQGNSSHVSLPFGGVKQSGIGRELGEQGVEIYTQIKAVHVAL